MFEEWKKEYVVRQKYMSGSREVFYETVIPFLPDDKKAVIVDIGAGDGSFAHHLNLKEKYENIVLLDGNADTVKNLLKSFNNVKEYTLPERMPFKDNSISLIHISHVVEHLYHEDLYKAMQEIDRALKKDGICVISTPLLWDKFYNDLSHVKPYNQEVFLNYLTKARKNSTNQSIHTQYVKEDLVFRYRSLPLQVIHSKYFALEVLIKLFCILLTKIGIRRYIKNGYTLILRKVTE